MDEPGLEVLREVLRAERRIRPYVRETYLEHSTYLSRLSGANVYCKLENLQYTGSFKARGAMNKLLSLSGEQRERGIVAASTGNHGAAVARSAGILGVDATIFVPNGTDASKIRAIESYGAKVRYYGDDCVESEVFARRFAEENGLVYVPPYNDLQVIGGQGTVGVEILRQLSEVDAIFASVGGGGLISGIAAYVKAVSPSTEIVGCSPENSQVMVQSVKAGRILDIPSLPTLSDGTAGGVEEGSITFDLCSSLVDRFVTVSEEEIRESLLAFMEAHHMLIEGAAAVAIASFLKLRDEFRGKNVVVVICGANIGIEKLRDVLQEAR